MYGLIGLTLFAGSYVGIALVSGAPLHQVAGISMFVSTPEGAAESGDGSNMADVEGAVPTPSELIEANVGLLGAYMIESPFSGSELRNLVGELKEQVREQTIERERLRMRNLELDEWEQALRERQAELAELRTKLEDLEGAVDLRMSELIRDESARDEKELQGWKDLAKLYTGGDAAVNAKMLTEESPKDAAKILRQLTDADAGEILRLITPNSVRKEYSDAYRDAEPAAPE